MSKLTLSDGREFTLLVDFEALIQAEGVYGKALNRLQLDAAAGFMGAVRALLFGALTAKHPRITAAEVSAMLQSDSEAVGVALAAAVEEFKPAAVPEPAEANAAPVRKAKPKAKAA